MRGAMQMCCELKLKEGCVMETNHSEGKAGYLVLESGRIFVGELFGDSRRIKKGGTVGEVVFTTGMTGYLETLSDPSFHGQIVVQTFPLIGNYGAIADDFESSRLHPVAYVVGECCEHPSNFRSQGSLDGLLKEHGLLGLSGVDTRALTRIIREAGVMNGAITVNPDLVNPKRLASHRVENAVAAVSIKEAATQGPDAKPVCRVALWDFGAKENIVRALCTRGAEVLRVPHSFTAQEILALEPDGVMLSNGPGDPSGNGSIIAEIGELLKRVNEKTTKANEEDKKIPLFGICLGHQLLALAAGARTQKLKYGHRGANQPVRDVRTGRVFITTQNHGYTVLSESVDTNIAEVRYLNANDGTCEGIDYRGAGAFGVQFHPEAAAGPLDTAFLFDRFFAMMTEKGAD